MCVLGLFLLYYVSIICLNLNSGQWYNYDMYADAMIAKYMAEYNTLFPENWTFGNQFYVVATPVLASLIYRICGDTVLSMGIASCIMTTMILICFWWCLHPFAKRKSILAGMLCLIGGTMFGKNAASDVKSLQVFYTMCSYYACYVIGILLTIGIWLRLINGRKVSGFVLLVCILANAALGMQSLREMLVLNLPLCVAAFFYSAIQKEWRTRANVFVGCAFFANLLGVALTKCLVTYWGIQQSTILQDPQGGILERIIDNVVALANYAGFSVMVQHSFRFAIIRLLGVLFIVGMVLLVFVRIWKHIKTQMLSAAILFCCVSLAGVFCAGIVVLDNRDIYYFVWQLLVAVAAVYLFELEWKAKWIRQCAIVGILVVCSMNYMIEFGMVARDYIRDRAELKKIAAYLEENDISHVFYDATKCFTGPSITAETEKDVLMAPVWFKYAGTSDDDLIDKIPYLSVEEWFIPEEADQYYLLLSQNSLPALGECRNDFEAMLTLEEKFEIAGLSYMFYTFEGDVLRDIQTE